MGLGDGSNWPSGEIVVKAIDSLKPAVIGEDPFNVEMLWNRMYRALSPMGVAGVAISALTGIETALWDIVRQVCGQAIYNLLGGRCWDRIRLYANSWFRGAEFTPIDYARAAVRIEPHLLEAELLQGVNGLSSRHPAQPRHTPFR